MSELQVIRIQKFKISESMRLLNSVYDYENPF